MRRTTCLILLLALPIGSGAQTPCAAAEKPGAADVLFERDVLPVFNAHCLQCHGGVHQRKGLDLRTLSAALKGSESGAVIVPGDPDASLLWKKLSTDEMPKTDNKVSAENKARVRAWIAGGAKGTDRIATRTIPRGAKDPAEIAATIDREIDRKLKEAGVPASPPADDSEFLRRVHLDLTGKPPTLEFTRAWLAETDPRKKELLVEGLLKSDDFGRHFAERWVNLFLLTTVNQRPMPPDEFVAWLGHSLTEGRPWNATVRRILTADGPLLDAPQGMFFYYNGDMNAQVTPKILAGNVGQVLLGIQIQCAECHDHPFNDWKQTDFWGMAAFFGTTTKMERVENNNTRGVLERQLEIRPGKKRDVLKEIAIGIPNDGEARNGGKKVPAGMLDGRPFEADPMQSHRAPFAEWLTDRENRLFARPAVNRFWAHFFARGFVNPLNDFGDHNTPTHPELLEALTDEFVASGHDLKHFVRCVTRSRAYRRTSRVAAGNEQPEAEPLFARMIPKVLTPEELHDALCTVLETPDLRTKAESSKPVNPKAPPGPSPRTTFVAGFRGPGEPDEPTELKLGVPHALRLMNQENFNTGGRLLERLCEGDRPVESVVEDLFLAALARRPSAEEAAKFAAFARGHSDPRAGCARVLWVLLNSSEFQSIN